MARAVPVTGRILGVLQGPSGESLVAVAPATGGGSATSRNRILVLSSQGRVRHSYNTPYATGAMALRADSLYWAGLTGANYTVWRTWIGRIDLKTNRSVNREWRGVAAGVGMIATADKRGGPVWFGASEIGGSYGLPYLVAYLPRSGRFAPLGVPSSIGGGVGDVVVAPTGVVYGEIPEASEVFAYDPTSHKFPLTVSVPNIPAGRLRAMQIAPTGTIWAVASWSRHVAFVSLAPNHWKPVVTLLPAIYASASGLTWQRGVWTVATKRDGSTGLLRLEITPHGPSWHFEPFAHAPLSGNFALIPGAAGSMWAAQLDGPGLWHVELPASFHSSARRTVTPKR